MSSNKQDATETVAEELQAKANTDRELWREGDGDGNGMSYYEPSIHVTQDGRIGINVGGSVYTLTLRQWHSLAEISFKTAAKVSEWYATYSWLAGKDSPDEE